MFSDVANPLEGPPVKSVGRRRRDTLRFEELVVTSTSSLKEIGKTGCLKESLLPPSFNISRSKKKSTFGTRGAKLSSIASATDLEKFSSADFKHATAISAAFCASFADGGLLANPSQDAISA